MSYNEHVRPNHISLLPFFFAIFGFLFTIHAFSDENIEKPIITILDFQLSNVSKEEGAVIVDFLMSYIIEAKEYRVIDRNERTSILEEIEFSVSDCTSEDCQIHIGELLSANQIIVGSLGKVSDRFILNIKLIDVKTGEATRTASEKYKSMNALIDDSKRLILNFIKKADSTESRAIVIVPKTKDELAAMPEQEIELKKQALISLLDKRKYRDPRRIPEIQDLSTYLYDIDKSILYSA